jgi:hypothetical protein
VKKRKIMQITERDKFVPLHARCLVSACIKISDYKKAVINGTMEL